MPWITRTSTLPVTGASPLFTSRIVWTRQYWLQQVFAGPSPPTDPAARSCCYDHSVWGDSVVGTPWTGTCPVLGAGQADTAWTAGFNGFLSVGLANSKDDGLPFTPTDYTVATTKTAMSLLVDTTAAAFAALIVADLGGVAPAAYEVDAVTVALSFTHTTAIAGTGWSIVIRYPAAGLQGQAHWVKPTELAAWPALATIAVGGDGSGSLPFALDGAYPAGTFTQELSAAVDAAEGAGVDLGYTPVTRSGNWQVQATSIAATYRYLPVAALSRPPLWQRGRIGVLDSPDQWTSGLVTPQSSPWQGGMP